MLTVISLPQVDLKALILAGRTIGKNLNSEYDAQGIKLEDLKGYSLLLKKLPPVRPMEWLTLTAIYTGDDLQEFLTNLYAIRFIQLNINSCMFTSDFYLLERCIPLLCNAKRSYEVIEAGNILLGLLEQLGFKQYLNFRIENGLRVL